MEIYLILCLPFILIGAIIVHAENLARVFNEEKNWDEQDVP